MRSEAISTAPIVVGDLDSMVVSFARHVRADRKDLSPRTTQSYLEACEQLGRFLAERGMPTRVESITSEHIGAFLDDLLSKYRPATALNRYSGLRSFFAWLDEEGEIPTSPMAKMRRPRVPKQVAPVPTDDHLKALLEACDGKAFEDRRDTALVRVFVDTGARLSEVAGLTLDDLDLDRPSYPVVRVLGKGNRERLLGLGAKTVKALDRYLRVRTQHPDARLAALWLGKRGAVTASGVAQVLKRRAREAGVQLHAHSLRHYFASEWLRQGGSESHLMELTGWRTREMVDRYAAATRADRALEEHERLSPGNRL